MSITLRPLTRQNFAAAARLKVAPDQESFVAPNLYSIAECYVEPTWTPLAIYAGDEMVGFATIGRDDETGRWWIIRFMIGAAHQNRGYGAAALPALIDFMRQRHACTAIYLGYEPDNAVAERLYARAGFKPTGEIDDGEIVARLDLSVAADAKER
ncbi:MAG TPA: GNAT family N-acetyltransferase [Thermomicrobiales bacterium]|nr:GNAT family N-acetyltransferase [Thermomicrobiales bacterium]